MHSNPPKACPVAATLKAFPEPIVNIAHHERGVTITGSSPAYLTLAIRSQARQSVRLSLPAQARSRRTFGSAGCCSERRTTVTKPKKPLGLSGPVVYCPECLRKIGVYKPGTGADALPVPGRPARRKHGRTAKCSKTAKPSRSVRAVAGGLPSLGKGAQVKSRQIMSAWPLRRSPDHGRVPNPACHATTSRRTPPLTATPSTRDLDYLRYGSPRPGVAGSPPTR
jgi:hypothetical protein